MVDMKGCDYSLTLIFAYAEVIAGDMSDKVRVIRFDALKRLQAILAFYKDRGYMEELLDGIAEKKCQMIMSVTSKTEMEKVLKPHCPHYDGVKFIPDTYNVPEEELIPDWERFVQAMNYAMMKQFSALEKGGRMAVLMGDIKKKGKLYSMIAEIVKPGTMENIIIKAQHNCFSDNTQYSGTFIPILHEYVLIVRKDSPTAIPVLMCSQKTMDIRDMPGATWRDVVAAVLEECNKAVSLAYLYEQIEPNKKARANQWWKEKIRQTLQCNPEHFDHVGRGLWCIRKSA